MLFAIYPIITNNGYFEDIWSFALWEVQKTIVSGQTFNQSLWLLNGGTDKLTFHSGWALTMDGE